MNLARHRWLSLALVACAVSQARGDTPTAGPDHLTPPASPLLLAMAKPEAGGNYVERERETYRRLVGREPGKLGAWMIAFRSMRPDDAISLQKIMGREVGVVAGYRLHWATAVWPRTPSGKVGVESRDIDIPKDAANEINAAWHKMILGTRYDEQLWIVLDGTDYTFGENGRVGHARGPVSGPPALLSRLGECLIDFAKADPAARPGQLAQCRELARSI